MKMRLMIAIPTTGLMQSAFVESLIKLVSHLHHEGIHHEVRMVSGTLVYIARNRLACDAINGNFSHVLWIDSDMVFSETVVEDLTFCGGDIVCGAFVSRRPPYGLCAYKSLEPVEHVTELGKEPFKIAGCGFGMVLTSVNALETVQKRFGNCFTPMPNFGEDLAFCRRAAEMRIPIIMDPTVRIGHIAIQPVYPGDSI